MRGVYPKELKYVGYSVGYRFIPNQEVKKYLFNLLILFNLFGCGGKIRTCDLRVMSPTSYQTAPPRYKRNNERNRFLERETGFEPATLSLEG